MDYARNQLSAVYYILSNRVSNFKASQDKSLFQNTNGPDLARENEISTQRALLDSHEVNEGDEGYTVIIR